MNLVRGELYPSIVDPRGRGKTQRAASRIREPF